MTAIEDELAAAAFVRGGQGSVATVTELAGRLRTEKRFDLRAQVLTVAARRALLDGWDSAHHAELAATMKAHQQFDFARQMFGRLVEEHPATENYRQQYALCVYKDAELLRPWLHARRGPRP